ncbi:MAG: N,N-dimethylformamidase beta subunit family domain-containing protein, partial [Bryobacteraceae bacterium]
MSFPLLLLTGGYAQTLEAQCGNPPNAIVAENCLPGNDNSEWDIHSANPAGDPSIQGFATDISVNRGSTVYFKIKTNAKAYTIDIYRMGYYQGNGARKVASISPSVPLPQTQPACLSDTSTGLYDCGNWAVSASWNVPATATSGIYFAHLIRTDTGGDSHIVFIVRNDASHSDVLFQTNDESWEAYNYYGGGSLYGPNTPNFDLTQRAYKVSYNRPFYTRGFQEESATWVFGAEYPMIRWLEANGYDVTYFTGVDAARNGSLIENHKVYLTSGHDEYWSGPHRANVEAARDAGVNMAFFTGNEVFWKTRWENSIDGTNTPYRTLVCYKETLAFSKIDPQDPPTWTGTWRDPSFSPPADGGLPENELTGTLFMVNGAGSDNPGNLAITVPAADGKMRFWRNTAIATLANGATYTLPQGTLGYEWDEDIDNGSRPPGAFPLSTTPHALTTDLLLDQGATYGAGTATHHLMMYRAKSGALVFGAGTVQWAWGLDDNHDDPFGHPNPPDPNMQQATVNLLADMGVQPATLQAGLVPATASTDKTPPTSVITSPAAGANIPVGAPFTITGTATDSGGGVVGGVEISIDNGKTWHPAPGRGSWSYTITPAIVGNTTILSRAVDDSGNLETPSNGVPVMIAEHDCPCESWPSSAVPNSVDSGDTNSVEVGVKFRTDYDGYITGIRFYKSAANTGTHMGNLWTSSGTLLASALFTNETGSGWQQATFGTPVAVTANTTYVASYFAPSGHYSADANYFLLSGQDDPPVHLLGAGVDGVNGVFSYGKTSVFPVQSYSSTNYWVDVVFVPGGSMPDAPPALLVTTTNLNFSAYVGAANPPSQPVAIFNQGSGTLNWTASKSASWLVLSPLSGTTPQSLSVSVNAAGLSAGTYTGTVTLSASGSNNPPQAISVTLNVTNLFLSSDFAGQGMQGWVLSPLALGSSWSIANDALEYNGSGNSQIFAGNSAWTDYIETATFKLSNLLDWPGGIRGRVNPATGAGYMVWAYPALSEIVLYKASAWDINQPLTQLGQASASFDTTNEHNLSLSFAGSKIQVLYDGNAVITATDSTYASGLVALEGDNQTIGFEQVLVTSGIANSGSIATGVNSLSFSSTYGTAN